MSIRAISTPESINAVNRIKSIIRNNGLGLKFKPSKESAEKKIYMQSDEFWNDKHNIKMFEYGEKVAEQRDKIAENIKEINKIAKDELVQGINGFARIKKYLDRNPKMNFSEVQSFHSKEENELAILQQYKIRNAAREVRNSLQK